MPHQTGRAREVLGAAAMSALSTLPSNPRDMMILDRWATDSPEQLLNLMERGLKDFHLRLRRQREAELDALSQPQARLMLKSEPETEVLQAMGVATGLTTT